jgi:S1-C subfamily serine protease
MSLLTSLSSDLRHLVRTSTAHLVELRGARFPASGIIWDTKTVVTVLHAMGRNDQGHVTVGTRDDRGHAKVAAKIVARDPRYDLALLEVDATLDAPAFAQPAADATSDASAEDPTSVGSLVVALGVRDGGAVATLGMITRVGPAWRTRMGGVIDRTLDVDGTLPIGGSGGLLLGARGEHLGLNTMGLRPTGATLDAATLRRVVPELRAGGHARRGFLGLGVQPFALPEALQQAWSQEGAVLVTGVQPGGSADRAGVAVGDILARVGETKVASLEELVGSLAVLGGKSTVVHLSRGGQDLSLQVAVDAWPERGQGCR